MGQPDFLQYINTIESKIHALDQVQDLEKFSQKVSAFYPTVCRCFEKEVTSFLNDFQKFGKIIDKVDFVSKYQTKELSSYSIDYEKQIIKISTNSGQEIVHELIPVHLILEHGLGVDKTTVGFYLLSSLFCQPDFFGSLQIYNIFICQLVPKN